MSLWDSPMMPALGYLAAILILGVPVVALCALFDKRIEGRLKKIGKPVRLIRSSLLVIFLDACLVFWWLAGFDDVSDPSAWAPAWLDVTVVVTNWPFLAGMWLIHSSSYDYCLDYVPLGVLVIVGLVLATGFFWGFVIELLCRMGARFRAKRALVAK
jgi:hypothetical protein